MIVTLLRTILKFIIWYVKAYSQNSFGVVFVGKKSRRENFGFAEET